MLRSDHLATVFVSWSGTRPAVLLDACDHDVGPVGKARDGSRRRGGNVEAGAANRLGATARGARLAADTRPRHKTRSGVAVTGASTSAWLCGPLHAD
jgi:hypothetical protein